MLNLDILKLRREATSIAQEVLQRRTSRTLLLQVPLLVAAHTPDSVPDAYSAATYVAGTERFCDFKNAYGLKQICGNPTIECRLMVTAYVDPLQAVNGDYLIVGLTDLTSDTGLVGNVKIPFEDVPTPRISAPLPTDRSYNCGVFYYANKAWASTQTCYSLLDVQLLFYGVDR